jgi:hypothetical protein
MPHAHLRSFACIAAAALLGGGLFAGAAQAADPPARIRDANPAQTHDLNGSASRARAMRPTPAAPDADMKGVTPASPATPSIPPTDADRKAGGAHRAPEKEGGLTTPIGTITIVHGEQPRARQSISIADQPSGKPGPGM